MLGSTIFYLLPAITIAVVSAEPWVSGFQRIRTPGTGTVRCDFPRPIIDCRIRVTEITARFDHLLQFGNTSEHSKTILIAYGGKNWIGRKPRIEEVRVEAKYFGDGLLAGHCGVTLKIPSYWPDKQVVLVECFGQEEGGGWDRGAGLITAIGWALLPATSSTAQRIVAKPGSNVDLSLRTQEGVRLGSWSVSTVSTAATRFSESDEGRTVLSVQPRNAGVWTWGAGTWSPEMATALWATMVLVEAPPRVKPLLKVRNKKSLAVGSLLEATCSAAPAVPPASITWLMDDRVVQQSPVNATQLRHIGTSRPWEPQAAVQTYSRLLTDNDTDSTLECRIHHPGLASPKSDSIVLRLTAAVSDVLPTSSTVPASSSTTSTPRVEETSTPAPPRSTAPNNTTQSTPASSDVPTPKNL